MCVGGEGSDSFLQWQEVVHHLFLTCSIVIRALTVFGLESLGLSHLAWGTGEALHDGFPGLVMALSGHFTAQGCRPQEGPDR